MTIDNLRQFGLSTKEAQVYLALIELGDANVSTIAQKAKINRTTTYDILESLANYSLVSRSQAKKRHYAAESPELLVSYLERKSKEFKEMSEDAKKILPELKATYNSIPKKPKVKYYDGEDGIIAMYEDSLTSKTEILSWLNTERTADFAPDYFAEYYKRRAKKNIAIKAIVNDVPIAHQIHARDKAELRKMKIIPKEKMDIVPECYIYDDKVSFMSLQEKFGVLIESKDIAEAQRKLYELAWQEADEMVATMKPKIEAEMKFRLKNLPLDLANGKKIEQLYLDLKDEALRIILEKKRIDLSNAHVARLRKITTKTSEELFLTIKSSGMEVREEFEQKILPNSYRELEQFVLPGKVLKTRYEVKVDKYKFEIDAFEGKLRGLVILEIEYNPETDDRDQIIELVDKKFGEIAENVTGDPQYSNSELAKKN